MLNHAEILLSTVQNLRGYLARHPHARGDLNAIRREWLPGELFPPEAEVVRQAVNVLVNAGELVGIDVRDLPPSLRVGIDPDMHRTGARAEGVSGEDGTSVGSGPATQLPGERQRLVYCAKDPLDWVAGY